MNPIDVVYLAAIVGLLAGGARVLRLVTMQELDLAHHGWGEGTHQDALPKAAKELAVIRTARAAARTERIQLLTERGGVS